MRDLDSLMLRVLPIVRDAGRIIKKNWDLPHSVDHKGTIDLVTETDRAVEAFLQKELASILPEASFLGEEGASGSTVSAKGLTWIVDPVDGTTNFVHRLPAVSVSVALCDNGHPLLGVVDAPILDECFYAARDSRAFCNGEPVIVSATEKLVDAVIGTGFPYNPETDLANILARIKAVLPVTQGLRRFGSAALDLCFVAAGRLDAYFEAELKPWDMAAGWLIVLEAGGQISDFSGANMAFGKPLLASNGCIHSEMVTLIS